MDLPRRVDDLQQKVENLSASLGIFKLKNEPIPTRIEEDGQAENEPKCMKEEMFASNGFTGKSDVIS